MPPRYQSHFLKEIWRKAAKFGGKWSWSGKILKCYNHNFSCIHANQIWVLCFSLWYRSNSRYADQRNLINTKTFDMTIFCRLKKDFDTTIFQRLEKNFWHNDLSTIKIKLLNFDMTIFRWLEKNFWHEDLLTIRKNFWRDLDI